MLDFLRDLLSTEGYHPHGYCYLWQPGLVWLHVVADSLIGLAYIAIGVALALFVRRASGVLPFSRMFAAFGVFIAACGATHFMEVWTLWNPLYWLAGSLKVVTAAASVVTAMALPPLVPLALSTLRDARLSERRRVELEEANRKLHAADELKTQFFANVSHELRTPLNLILGPVNQLLGVGRLGPQESEQLRTVRRNAELLLRHVNDLLDVARLEAGRMEVEHARVDLARLVRLASSHFASALDTRHMSFTLETPDALPAEVDPEKVERILFNLLGNALKFTPEGGRILVMLERDGGSSSSGGFARIAVHDSGPGVPPELREEIFQPFRQGQGGAGRRFAGTGLGLAIVSDFARLHGGTARVGESPLGGAAFVVELPMRAPSGAEVRGDDVLRPLEASIVPPEPEAPRPDHGEARVVKGDPARPLVLVVEDNPELNHFVSSVLAADYRVARAFDGAEGIRRALELRPDLILSDVMMPEATGEDLVRAVRSRPELAGTPILLVSARADDELRVRLLREGAQDYLMKPFSTEEMRARVSVWVEMKRARDLLQRELSSTLEDVEALASEVVTRRTELESALQAARLALAEAEAANRAKADFLSVMSHELRTPLNAILGYADLLQLELEGPLSEKQRAFVDRVRASADHLLAMVTGILGYARIDAGVEAVHPEPVELGALVGETAALLQPRAAEKGLDLRVSVPEAPVRLRTDPAKVRQIVLNLVENAVKFTDGGHVSVELLPRDGRVLLRVADTGEGIAPEHRERVFEPFWQVDPSKTRRAGGTGLGLSITRRLVEMLGGRIAVESVPGEGSTFSVSLPRGDGA